MPYLHSYYRNNSLETASPQKSPLTPRAFDFGINPFLLPSEVQLHQRDLSSHSVTVVDQDVATLNFAENLTVKAFGAIARGSLDEGIGKLTDLSSSTNLGINAEVSAQKMSAYINKNPYTDSNGVLKKKQPLDKYTIESNEPRFLFPRSSIRENISLFLKNSALFEPFTIYETSVFYHPGNSTRIDKENLNPENTLTSNLTHLSDREIFARSIPIDINCITSGEQVINFNNVKYKGACPNISLKLSMPLSSMYRSKDRFAMLEYVLKQHHLPEFYLPSHSTSSLMTAIASHINRKKLSQKEKEDLLEKVCVDMTIILVGSKHADENTLIQFDDYVPLERNYLFHGYQSTNLVAFHAFAHKTSEREHLGSISTDLLIKQGGADCRGTNAILAMLLNTGYKEISSSRKAHMLYAKVQDGVNAKEFEACEPADHNMVVTNDGRILDAFFGHFNNQPLRELVDGVVLSNGWLAKINCANPYPNEQNFN